MSYKNFIAYSLLLGVCIAHSQTITIKSDIYYHQCAIIDTQIMATIDSIMSNTPISKFRNQEDRNHYAITFINVGALSTTHKTYYENLKYRTYGIRKDNFRLNDVDVVLCIEPNYYNGRKYRATYNNKSYYFDNFVKDLFKVVSTKHKYSYTLLDKIGYIYHDNPTWYIRLRNGEYIEHNFYGFYDEFPLYPWDYD